MLFPFPSNHDGYTIMAHRKPEKICSIAHWNTSDAELILKGMHKKRYLPKGVAKVANREDSLSNLICQNELLASSTEKTLALDICEATSSTVRMGW